MNARALIGAIRFTAAIYMEIHRACKWWWAEETDRAAAKKEIR